MGFVERILRSIERWGKKEERIPVHVMPLSGIILLAFFSPRLTEVFGISGSVLSV